MRRWYNANMLTMQRSPHKKLLITIGVIAVLLGVGYLFVMGNATPSGENDLEGEERTLISTVTYSCDGEKSIVASYYEGLETQEPEQGEMPTPTGSVEVSLDGGASMTLAQTISASGVRYANEDESFVFWNKGNEALVMRDNSMDLEYTNCTSDE